jgi:catechol 2,3-dioxygenase-like lactoylglutathione lyase family enzyme
MLTGAAPPSIAVLATTLSILGCTQENAPAQRPGTDGRVATSADASASKGDAAARTSLCSGCPSDVRDPNDTSLRVHHIHLNVKDAKVSARFYEKHFGAKPVQLNGVAAALWAEPLLFLLEEGDFTPSEELRVGFEHVGMGVKDPQAWFDAASKEGIMVDPRNGAPNMPVSFPIMPGTVPNLDPGVDAFAFVYVRGPNSERIEVWSGLSKFRHAHFMTPDIDGTVAWYEQLLGVPPLMPKSDPTSIIPTNGISLDGVQLNFLAPAAPVDFTKTDGQALDHIAFSVPDLDSMFEHVKALGVPVVSEPGPTPLGFRSFFVRAPQEVLLEFVAAGPVSVP